MRSWKTVVCAAALLAGCAEAPEAEEGDSGPRPSTDAGVPDVNFAGWDAWVPDAWYPPPPDAWYPPPPDAWYAPPPDVYIPPGVDGGQVDAYYPAPPDAWYAPPPDAHYVVPDAYYSVPDAGNPNQVPLPPDAPLRRLTGEQYDNTVRDLLRITSFSQINLENPSRSLPADEAAGPFDANHTSAVTLTHIDQYGLIADVIADNALNTLTVSSLARCDRPGASCCAAQDEACARAFITNFGLRAYRRPLVQAEIDSLLTVYRAGAVPAGSSAFRNGIELTLSAILQMGSFLYFMEDTDGPLTDYEIATRLSYFVWNTMPDDTLLDAARMGQLRTPAQIGAQFDRLFADPRAERQIADFHLMWLSLRNLPLIDKSVIRYPLFMNRDVVRSRLQRSFERQVNYIVRDADSRYVSLMTAPIAFMGNAPGETGTDPITQIYNVTLPSGHVFNNPVGVDPTRRRGVLTHPAYLSVHAREVLPYPVGRGLNVIRNVLCLDLPPPPLGVDTTIPPQMPGMTRRQVMENYHEAQPLCAGCHTIIDPIGFTFDLYGALGEYRTFDLDDNAPVNATGTMNFNRINELYIENGITQVGLRTDTIGAQLDGPVTGAVDLINDIAVSRIGHDCYALQWYRFATQRPERPADEPTIASFQQQFAYSGGNIRELLRSIATSDLFRNR